MLEEKHPSHPVALFFHPLTSTTAISLFLIFVTSASRYHPSVILSPLSPEKIKASANLTNEEEISYSAPLLFLSHRFELILCDNIWIKKMSVIFSSFFNNG